jgi:hypothetical protein
MTVLFLDFANIFYKIVIAFIFLFYLYLSHRIYFNTNV